MVDRLLWMLLVIVLAVFASVLGAFLRRMLMPVKKTSKKRKRELTYDDYDEEGWTTRNAPKNPMTVWIMAAVGGVILLSLFTCSIVMILVQYADQQDPAMVKNGAPPPPPPPPPPQPPNLVAPVPEDLGPKEKVTEILGGAFDPTFRDDAPPGGQLIGFEIGLGEFFGTYMVGALQPIYRTPQGEVAGRKFGTEARKRVTVKAKPGYAVGAINVKAGLIVNGFSTTFMRVKGPRLDPGDAYSSPWIGDNIGGNGPTLLAGDGIPIVGVIGKRNAKDCTGIGLLKK